MEEYPKIGWVSLKQQGWFLARIRINFHGDHGAGITDSWGNIAIGQLEAVDPGDPRFFKRVPVPNGSIITLRVDVTAGNSAEAQQSFTYEQGNPNTAKYVIAGTTLDNQLGLISVVPEKHTAPPAHEAPMPEPEKVE